MTDIRAPAARGRPAAGATARRRHAGAGRGATHLDRLGLRRPRRSSSCSGCRSSPAALGASCSRCRSGTASATPSSVGAGQLPRRWSPTPSCSRRSRTRCSTPRCSCRRRCCSGCSSPWPSTAGSASSASTARRSSCRSSPRPRPPASWRPTSSTRSSASSTTCCASLRPARSRAGSRDPHQAMVVHRDHVALGPGRVHDGHLPRGAAGHPRRRRSRRRASTGRTVAGLLARGLAAARARSPCSSRSGRRSGDPAVRPRLHDDPRRPARARPRRSCTTCGRRRSSNLQFGYGSAVAYGLFVVTLIVTIGVWSSTPAAAGRRPSDEPTSPRRPADAGGVVHPSAPSPAPGCRSAAGTCCSRPMALLFAMPFVADVPDARSARRGDQQVPARASSRRASRSTAIARLFTDSDVLHWLLNTVDRLGVAVASHLVLCSLAGYGFARLKFPGATSASSRSSRRSWCRPSC